MALTDMTTLTNTLMGAWGAGGADDLKAAMKDAIVQTFKVQDSLLGARADYVYMDEWPAMTFQLKNAFNQIYKLDLGVVATYEHEAFPVATIHVYEDTLDKHDPRNPNPHARHGSKDYRIMCGEKRIGGRYPTLAAAKLKASTMHKQMVEALLEKRRERAPAYGRF